MTETNTAVIKKDDKEMEYIPFGGKDPIKLTISLVRNQLSTKTKSGKSPTDDDCIKFLMLCKARLLNPWESDAFLVGYDTNNGPKFNLITAHQAFLKRAEMNPEYDGMKSGIIVEENDQLKDIEGDFYVSPAQRVVGGWATVYFKNRKYPMSKRVRLARFNKGFGVWAEDAAGMICKCAEADALRSAFPTMLGGLYLKQEVQPEEPAVSAPIFTSNEPVAAKTAAKEVIIDVTPPAEVMEAPVPPPPTPPAARKAAPKAPTPPKTPPSQSEALKARIIESGVTVEQCLSVLKSLGLAEKTTATLEELVINHPDAFKLLEDDLESITSDIKST